MGPGLKKLLVFLDELSEKKNKAYALRLFRKISLSVEVAPHFFVFLDEPHSFRRRHILLVLATLLGIVKRVY